MPAQRERTKEERERAEQEARSVIQGLDRLSDEAVEEVVKAALVLMRDRGQRLHPRLRRFVG